jgi:hypothetical protein
VSNNFQCSNMFPMKDIEAKFPESNNFQCSNMFPLGSAGKW